MQRSCSCAGQIGYVRTSRCHMSAYWNKIYLIWFNMKWNNIILYEMEIRFEPCLNQILWDWWNKFNLDKFRLMRVKKTIEYKEKGLSLALWLRWLFDLSHSERRPKIFIPKRKSTSIVSSNWQHKFLYFHYKSVKLDVLCRQNKIWTFGNPFQSKKLPICT